MIPSDDELLYWVAIRDTAVPHWPFPASVTQMQTATVQVGESGEDTIWLLGPADGGSIPELPIQVARAEAHRAMAEETVIRRFMVNPAPQIDGEADG
jgi:hypothetical protein